VRDIAIQELQIKNCKSRIANQELQIINCKSRIANHEMSLKDSKEDIIVFQFKKKFLPSLS
jgi:hypothetical protein